MFNVTDANGKEFEFTLEQLQDTNSNLFNSQPHKTSTEVDLKDHVVTVFNEDGVEIGKVGDISCIGDSKNKDDLPKALKVSIEATHSGDNHNYAIYHSDSMENDASTFIYPYKKPIIKNHDSREEPLGRVASSLFKESDICTDRDTVLIDAIVNDQDAIEKFLDGRYRTVSIGGSVGHIKCNICGKDILKDKKVKFCGHWKGEKYGDNVALWHMRDIKYNECSIVNNPADDWAQVVKIVVLSDDKATDNENEQPEPVKDSVINDNDENDNINIIDNLLNDDKGEGENTDPEPSNVDPADSDPEENPEENPGESIDSLKEQISNLEKDIENKDNIISNLEVSTEELTTSLATVQNKHDEYRNISINLANLNKKLLVDKVILLKQESLNDNSTSVELMSLSAKELNCMVDELINNKPNNDSIPDIPKVPNPAFVNLKDKYAIGEDDTKVIDSSNPDVRNKNVVDSIINNLCK